MKNQSLQIIHFLIPVIDRDGRPYIRNVHKQIQRELEDRFGGWTLLSTEPLPGAWKAPDTGEVEYDESWPYEVGIPPERLQEFDDFLAAVAFRLGQKTIWRVLVGEGKAITAREPKRKT